MGKNTKSTDIYKTKKLKKSQKSHTGLEEHEGNIKGITHDAFYPHWHW